MISDLDVSLFHLQAYNPRHVGSKSYSPFETPTITSDRVGRALGDRAFCDSATAHKAATPKVAAPLRVRLRQPGYSGYIAVSAEEGRISKLQNVGCVLPDRASERNAHVGCRRGSGQQLQAGRNSFTAELRNCHQEVDGPIGRDRICTVRHYLPLFFAFPLGPYRECQRVRTDSDVAGSKA